MSLPESNLPSSAASNAERDEELTQIRDALRGLRFGAVNVIVQDGVVVQIDRTEKRRVRRSDAK
ncbi:MAG TPA: YezD family protein [Pirellulaceae bacterium]|nr:YezD family protein [Pirellulaceae bacterium]